MAQKKKPTDATSLDYSNIKPEEDGRSWYLSPKGWKPEKSLPVPALEGATQEDDDAVIRRQLLPHEDFWRRHGAYPEFCVRAI